MSLVLTDEMCDIHFLDPQPKVTCTICTHGLSKKPSNQYEPERVIIPTDKIPRKPMHMWTPFQQPISSIPRESDFVHITTTFSTDLFDQLAERLEGLVLVEVVPSSASIVERHLWWFQQYRVGITARRRWRQS